jgi:CheY-like chemotaxis protein
MTMPTPDSPSTAAINILMIEDQHIVGASLREAVAGLQIPYRLTICPNSAEALAHLRGDGPAASPPDVIVLDGAVSESERRALLTAVQRDAALHHIPVILVADSPGRNDGAWVYYIPPQIVTAQTLTPLLRSTYAIAEFWGLLSTLFTGDEEGAPAGRPGGETPGRVPPRAAPAKKR